VITEQLRYGAGKPTTPTGAIATAGFLAGGVLVIWLSYIHFHLWQSLGYRHIPTIGPLFLAQSVAGLVLGLSVIVFRRVWVAVMGIGFCVATMAGFLISVENGLFGFKDSWSAPYAHESFVVEIVAAVVLALAGAACFLVGEKTRHNPRRHSVA
jgi:hypothetical protein